MAYNLNSNIGKLQEPKAPPTSPASISIMHGNEASLSIENNMNASINVVNDAEASISLERNIEASLPIISEREASMQLEQQTNASMNIIGEVSSSTQLQNEITSSLGITQTMEASIPMQISNEASMALDRGIESSLNVLANSEASMSLERGVEGSLSVMQSMEASTIIEQSVSSSTQLFGEQSSSTAVMAENSSSIPIGTEMQASIPMQSEVASSIQVGIESAASIPMQTEQSSSLPMQTEQASSVSVQAEYAGSIPVQGEASSSVGLQSDTPSSIAVQSEMASSVPVQGEMQASIAMQGEIAQSIGLYNNEVASKPLLSDKNFGYNSVALDSLSIKHAINADSGIVGRIKLGKTIAKGTDVSSTSSNGTLTTIAPTHYYNMLGCMLGDFGGYIANMDSKSFATFGIPAQQTGDTIVSLTVAEKYIAASENSYVIMGSTTMPVLKTLQSLTIRYRIPANASSVNIIIPKSDAFATVLATTDKYKNDTNNDVNMILCPFFIPMITDYDFNPEIKFVHKTTDTQAYQYATLLNVASPNGYFTSTGAHEHNGDYCHYLANPIESLRCKYNSSSTANLHISSMDGYFAEETCFDTCFTKGYSSGITVDSNDWISIVYDVTEIQPLVFDTDAFDKETKKVCGKGVIKLTVRNVVDSANTSFSSVSNKYIVYEKKDFSPSIFTNEATASSMTNSTDYSDILAASSSRDGNKIYPFKPSSGSANYYLYKLHENIFSGYHFHIIGYDTTNSTDVWIPCISDGTTYYLPNNVNRITQYLPSSGTSFATKAYITEIKVILDSLPYKSAIVTLRSGSTLYNIYLCFRLVSSINGSSYMNSELQKTKYVLSAYVLNTSSYINYEMHNSYGLYISSSVARKCETYIGKTISSYGSSSYTTPAHVKPFNGKFFCGTKDFMASPLSNIVGYTAAYGGKYAIMYPEYIDESIVAIGYDKSLITKGINVPLTYPTIVFHYNLPYVLEADSGCSSTPIIGAPEDWESPYSFVGSIHKVMNFITPNCSSMWHGVKLAGKFSSSHTYSPNANFTSIMPTTGTYSLYETPIILAGGALASLPATSEEYFGYDVLGFDTYNGKDYFTINNKTYTAIKNTSSNSVLYPSSVYKLNANPITTAIKEEGDVITTGNFVAITNSSSASIYSFTMEEGFKYVTSVPDSIKSNIVKIQNNLIFVTSKYIMAFDGSRVIKLYDMIIGLADNSVTGVTSISDAIIHVPTNSYYCITVKGNDNKLYSFFIDDNLGISLDNAVISTSNISMIRVNNGEIPILKFINSSTLAISSPSTTDASTFTMKSWSIDFVRDNTNKFVLTGLLIYMDVLAYATADIDIYIYNNSLQIVSMVNPSFTYNGSQILFVETGSIPVSYLSYKITNAKSIIIDDVKAVGYYAPMELVDSGNVSSVPYGISDGNSVFTVSRNFD